MIQQSFWIKTLKTKVPFKVFLTKIWELLEFSYLCYISIGTQKFC